jgi:chromosome segregation ATPase
MFFTTSPVVTDIDDEPEPIREAPDRSHVVPPPAELPPTRDEALEELSRRLDVIATRADRLDRSVEKLSPVQIADMPSRAELRAIESLANANRERADLLERRLVESRDADTAAEQSRTADRTALSELAAKVAGLEARLRGSAEEVHDLREARNTAEQSLRELREDLLDRDAGRAAEFSRRLAGAYTVAIVALLAALLTFALMLSK